MYSVKLDRFQGPMDLLLHLIQKAEVDIKDIFVSEITSQYLEYMESLDELEPDAASEFAAMAATLLLIKSRALLPRPAPLQEDEEDPEQVLIRQIREYKLFKEAGEKLAELKAAADNVFWKLPEEFPLPPQEVEFTGGTADKLYEAFSRVMLRAKNSKGVTPFDSVRRDYFNIAERMSYLSARLKSGGRVAFEALFSPTAGRLEVIVTFMALLELVACGRARVEQDSVFGEIYIKGGANHREETA